MINVSFALFPNYGSHYDPAVAGPFAAIAALIVIFLWGPKTWPGTDMPDGNSDRRNFLPPPKREWERKQKFGFLAFFCTRFKPAGPALRTSPAKTGQDNGFDGLLPAIFCPVGCMLAACRERFDAKSDHRSCLGVCFQPCGHETPEPFLRSTISSLAFPFLAQPACVLTDMQTRFSSPAGPPGRFYMISAPAPILSNRIPDGFEVSEIRVFLIQ
ncbi:hypothetical protein [Caldibacillus debilis]|jgi:hypothetical protein|uniref:Uncharacterized protein n=1 Tax=Caldibacillus debilis GB1 TaxID=1339248 RepID=A0A420VHN1_9BACI|nr:hypothetical protein [Caldibacillus debilis]RKO63182.1 hypothetical protein Cdeb_00272 [Caldibacillus debilis GB1]